MKRISILFAVLALCAISASATGISKSKAQNVAAAFFQKGLMKDLSKGAEVKLVKEYASSVDAPAAVYAFSRGENVVFVSAEEKMPAILGYSANADVNNLPPALEEMLRYYAHLSDAVREGRIEAPKLYASAEPVDSLLHTCWYQEAPFYDMCPEVDGMKTADGCVATAFAMVMKYHNWPDKPEGKSPKYTTRSGIEIPEVDLSSHTYRWDDMINIYKKGAYTEEQGQAVAQLCYDIAVASNMNFDVEGSGTKYALAIKAMRTYFKYNKGLRLECAHFHTEEEWATMLKNEISQGRPLPYDAQTNTGDTNDGHCFVIDGFNAEGLFHVNWGWGGRSDGFFLITTLNPAEEGMSESPSGIGYAMRQRTLFDFVPDKTGTSTPSEENCFLKYDNCVSNNDDKISIKKISNWGIEDFYGDLILQLVDKDGYVIEQKKVFEDCHSENDDEHDITISLNDYFDFSKFADGIYHTEMTAVPKATKKEYPMAHIKPDHRIIIENGKLKTILKCAILDGEIIGVENVTYENMLLSLTMKGQVKNVDDIDFLPSDILQLRVNIYSTETHFQDKGYAAFSKKIKPGEVITIEGKIEVDVVTAESSDKLKLKLVITNGNNDIVFKEYPFDVFLATGIKDIVMNKVEGKSPAYNINGQRVDASSAKGVIIKDGVKRLTIDN